MIAKTLTAATFAIGFAAAASAVTIQPISAVGSSSFGGYADSNAVDNNPLSDWASLGQGNSSALSLDLGGVYTLTSAAVTDRVTSGGGNNAFFGGLVDFTTSFKLSFFTDAAFTNEIGSVSLSGLVGPSGATLPSQFLTNVSLPSFNARYVRYSVLATNGDNPGLSDIRFEGTPVTNAIPEPGTWALLIVGFGMVGVTARRRKAAVAA